MASFTGKDRKAQREPVLIERERISPYQFYVGKPENVQVLADDIAVRGLITPIYVREDPLNPGHYVINDGHCRYLACEAAGLTVIPCFIDNDNLQNSEIA